MHKRIAHTVSVASAAVAISAALLAPGAMAAATTELKVTGVIRPHACTPTIGAGNAAVDYGSIAASSLEAGKNKVLDTKEVAFSISCEAAAKTAIRVTDNRAASKVKGLGKLASATAVESNMFGLGTASSKNIGAFLLGIKPNSFTGDGNSVDLIHAVRTSGTAWIAASNNLGGQLVSWTSAGGTQPGAYKTVSGTLEVTAVLDKPENLDLTQDITLDGSATIEVRYL